MMEYIRVVAPAALDEGYSFDVLIEGRPFTVVVPEGGVQEGEEFEVPYLLENGKGGDCESIGGDEENQRYDSINQRRYQRDDLKMPPTMSNSADEDDGIDCSSSQHDRLGTPYGQFRVSFCSCCDVVTQATFWMALCCFPVLLAQILTRLRLKWNGQEIDEDVNNIGEDDDCSYTEKKRRYFEREEENAMTFNKIVLTFVGVLAFGYIPLAGTLILVIFYVVCLLVIGGNVRSYVRRRYKIPNKCSSCLPSSFEDRCTMCFCGCCAIIQVARHTHDDKEHSGYCCTTTGLELGAPQVPPMQRDSTSQRANFKANN